VREIDKAQDAIDHRVAQRNEREDGTKRQAIDQLLKELSQGVERVAVVMDGQGPGSVKSNIPLSFAAFSLNSQLKTLN
jgi:hypothetical protein